METLPQEEFEFLVIDHLENAIDNLAMLDLALSQPVSIKWWKWAMISAHQALYDFAIAALVKSAPYYTVVEENRAARIFRYLIYEDKTVPEIARLENLSQFKVKKTIRNGPRLINLRKALVRLQLDKDKHCLPWANSVPLRMSISERRAIKRLIEEFRNGFEHYFPKTWAIPDIVLPEILVPTLRVIRYIALESNCIFFHNDELERVTSIFSAIEHKLGIDMQ